MEPETRIALLDVSKWQGSIDWPRVAKEMPAVRAVIAKATEGVGYVDPQWGANAKGVRANGLLLGSYHYLRVDGDGRAQARHYASVVRDVAELPPVADVEDRDGRKRVGNTRAHECAVAFVEEVEQVLGRECVVYTYPSWWRELGSVGAASPLGSRPLWIAHYRVQAPSIPAPWTKWLWWQWDDGAISKLPGGGAVDANWYAGSYEELLTLAGRGPAPEPHPAHDWRSVRPVERPDVPTFVASLADD